MNKVLIVSNGSREHALAWKLAQSPKVGRVYVAPGNGGIDGDKLESVAIAVEDHQGLVGFAKEYKIDLVVVSQDDALAAGLADDFRAAGFTTFGCSKAVARIESSKAFAKDLMEKAGIKTATHQTFTDRDAALLYVEEHGAPIVVKASGLALGKGVYVCETHEEAETALSEIMTDKKFGESGNEVVIEDFLEGTELSTHAFCDGKTAVMFPPSQDHKAIGDGNTGPNTGGMGVVAPLPWANAALMQQAKEKIVEPAIKALDESGTPFQGLLYPGLMEKDGALSVVEFNARFGQPECECYMRLLESDLYDILLACATGNLKNTPIDWSKQFVAGVILASEGYPESYAKGKVITGIEEAESDSSIVVFHVATKRIEDGLVTNGGRVLHVTATADTLEDAIRKAYEAANKIQFEGKYMRTDIGANTLHKK